MAKDKKKPISEPAPTPISVSEATAQQTTSTASNDTSQGKGKRIPFAVSEAYKSIRTNLVSMMQKENKKVFVISSPNAAEGKSTTSINVAISFSQLKKKVLLIDADAHRPSIHLKMRLNNDVGFLNILTGESTFEKAIHPYNDYLDILPAGPLVSNPTELLASDVFGQFLDQLRLRYDCIIIDAPPVNILSDAQIMAQKCDGMLLVVRAGITTHDSLRRSLAVASSLYVNVVGFILNGSDYGTKRYYSRYYSKYYNRYYDRYYNRYYRS